MGDSIASGGDLNGDGIDDLAIGDPGPGICLATLGGGASAVHVFYGSKAGLSKKPDWSKRHDAATLGSCLGDAVDIGGDVDGDGFDDLVVSASVYKRSTKLNNKGRAYVFRGGPDGLASTASWSQSFDTFDSVYYVGRDLSSGGDIDGDGYDDVVMTAQVETGEGDWFEIFVFRGSKRGLGKNAVWKYGRGSTPVAWAGDVDADGFDDFIFADSKLGRAHYIEKVTMFHGSMTGVAEPAAWTYGPYRPNVQKDPHHGSSLDTAGDVNGDGYDDIIVGTPNGRGAYVFRGGPNPEPVAMPKSVQVVAGQASDVALVGSDPDGDPVTYSVIRGPDHGSIDNVDPGKATVAYEPRRGFTGQDRFTFEVADPYGGTDTATVDLLVVPPNEPPRFVVPTPVGTVEAVVGEALTFMVAARDPDGDPLSYGLAPRPSGASFDRQSGVFRWTPGRSRAGDVVEVTLSAEDGETTTERDVDIRVVAAPMDTGVAGDTGRGDSGGAGDVQSQKDTRVEDTTMPSPDGLAKDSGDDLAPGGPPAPKDGCNCSHSGRGGGMPVGGLLIFAMGVAFGGPGIRRGRRR